jgi:hypothetical protein
MNEVTLITMDMTNSYWYYVLERISGMYCSVYCCYCIVLCCIVLYCIVVIGHDGPGQCDISLFASCSSGMRRLGTVYMQHANPQIYAVRNIHRAGTLIASLHGYGY